MTRDTSVSYLERCAGAVRRYQRTSLQVAGVDAVIAPLAGRGSDHRRE